MNQIQMIIIAIAAATVAFLVFISLLYLYHRKSGKDEEPDETDEESRSDVKQQRKHEAGSSWWTIPITTKSAINSFLSHRGSFEIPEKQVKVENVQPEGATVTHKKALGRGRSASTVSDTFSEGKTSPRHRASPSVDMLDEPGVKTEGVTPQRMSSSNDPDAPLGKLHFGIQYDFTATTLTVVVRRGVGLPAKDFSGTSDPYVKILLLPDRKTKMETSVKRRCLNPYWNETFCFEGFPYQKVQSRILNLQVYDYDKFSRNDPIGEVFVPLCEVNMTDGCTLWKSLQPIQKSREKTGELLMSLCYHPVSSKLVVTVLKGKNLKGKDFFNFSGTKTSDPYVKIWLVQNGKKLEKKKTLVKRVTLHPVFNESFLFIVSADKIRDTALLVSAMDHDRVGRNEVIGSVLLSRKSGPTETRHWNDMLLKPKHPIAQWHSLRN